MDSSLSSAMPALSPTWLDIILVPILRQFCCADTIVRAGFWRSIAVTFTPCLHSATTMLTGGAAFTELLGMGIAGGAGGRRSGVHRRARLRDLDILRQAGRFYQFRTSILFPQDCMAHKRSLCLFADHVWTPSTSRIFALSAARMLAAVVPACPICRLSHCLTNHNVSANTAAMRRARARSRRISGFLMETPAPPLTGAVPSQMDLPSL